MAQHPSLVNLFDEYRTPGYPVFLSLLDAVRGQNAGDWVAVAQAALLVLAAFEMYVVTYGLSASRVAGTLSGTLIGTNLFLLDWERTIMSEALGTFALSTAVLAYWLWMRHRTLGWAALFSAASVLAVLTKPSLLVVPFCLVALALVGDRRRSFTTFIVATAIAAPLAGFGLVNDRLYPHAGFTAVSNINLLGKILEYQMEGEGDATRFPALWRAANNLPANDPNPYSIEQTDAASLGVNWVTAGQFSQDIIRRHPLEYAVKSGRDLINAWLIPPYTFAPVGASVKTLIWMRFSLAAYDAYLLVPLAMITLVALWRRLDQSTALGTAATGVAVGAVLVITALFGYVDVARLRTAVDPLAMVLVIVVTAQVIGLSQRTSSGRVSPSTLANLQDL